MDDAGAADRSDESRAERPQPAVVNGHGAAVSGMASGGNDVLMQQSEQEEEDPAAVMQSLLSSLLALQSQLPDLNALFSTASTDAEFRSHAALASVLPQVDALHRMTATGFSSALSFTASSGSPLSSLPSPLLYLFVRLVLTPSVNHSRACLLVSHCLSQAADGAPHRLLLLTLSYAMATHPAAVFTSLLEPLLTPPQSPAVADRIPPRPAASLPRQQHTSGPVSLALPDSLFRHRSQRDVAIVTEATALTHHTRCSAPLPHRPRFLLRLVLVVLGCRAQCRHYQHRHAARCVVRSRLHRLSCSSADQVRRHRQAAVGQLAN